MYKLSATVISTIILSTSPVLADESWTGFYVGAQVGTSNLAVEVGGVTFFDENDFVYGLHGGYNHDFGKYVVGAEIDYDMADFDNGGGLSADLETIRLKLRGGYDFGRFLGYGVVSVSENKANGTSENGLGFGLGASYRAAEHVIISAEYLRDHYHDLGADLDLDTFTIRAAYKF